MKRILLKISLAFFISLYGIFNVSASTGFKIAEQDSLALLAFYWATDGPNWISNQPGFDTTSLTSEWQERYKLNFGKWLDGPVENWYGIKLELQAINNSTDSVYRVTELQPVIGRRAEGENLLKGFIPREVGYLTALQVFLVNGNVGLAGSELPDDIYLPMLVNFDVEGCSFGGEITDAFKNCINSQRINIRYNNFDYMPTLEFLPEEVLRRGAFIAWVYSCQFSPAIFEKTIEHFYAIDPEPGYFSFEMRDNNNVGDEEEVVAPLGTSVELICDDAGERSEDISYQWFKNGLSRIGKTKYNYEIASVKASDYGDYKVKISNEYTKGYDRNPNYGEIFTKEIHLVETPVAPEIVWARSSYNGQQIQLRFTKQMDPNVKGFDHFVVKSGERIINIVRADTYGRINRNIILTLSDPINPNEDVSIALNNTGLIDKNGGELQVFEDLTVENMVKSVPKLLKASTTKDGAFIDLEFDAFIDPNLLTNLVFQVSGNVTYEVSEITLKNGLIDNNISKQIRLKLINAIDDGDEALTFSYISGSLAGLYSGTVAPFQNESIENTVISEKKDVFLSFIDGSERLKNILLSGSWTSGFIQMFDNGTNGDKVAGDHIWSVSLPLVYDTYTWELISRTVYQSSDTVRSVDPETGIETLTIYPMTLYEDSVLNGSNLLQFETQKNQVLGDTLFALNNQMVVFRLTLDHAGSDVYLMGIDEDWGIGNEMTFNGTYYSDTLYKYSVGDIISYSFREGNYWENKTPQTREYIVKDGNNIVEHQFGVFTDINHTRNMHISMYYNQATHYLIISGNVGLCTVQIYSLSGQEVLSTIQTISPETRIQANGLQKGLYVAHVRYGAGKLIRTKFLVN